jgi:hypothetical protein
MLLGDLIARFDDEVLAAETLLSLEDLALTTRVQDACVQDGLTSGEFASMAVQKFSATASEEEWVTVIGLMARTKEPGLVLLRRSLIWMLTPHPEGCTCAAEQTSGPH